MIGVLLLRIQAADLDAATKSAEPIAVAPSTPRVGDLGRLEALEFRGLHQFLPGQLRYALRYLIEFHLAAHPSAPLSDYLAFVRTKVAEGYRRAGFPDVSVELEVEESARKVVVTVQEGPKYTCGDVKLTGVPALTTPQVRAAVLEALGGAPEGQVQLTNLFKAIWAPGKAVPFDELSRRHIADRVHSLLTDLNYYQPRLTVNLVPDPARQRADLVVDFLSEGTKGQLQEIDIVGARQNPASRVTEFLGLKPGQEIGPKLFQDLTNRLWQSGRFLGHSLSLEPLAETGKFRLKVELRELEEAPPLSQELSLSEQAMVRHAKWLSSFPEGPEDLVLELLYSAKGERWQSQWVFSPAGAAFGLYHGSSNASPRLVYGGMFTRELVGLFSGQRKRKLLGGRNASEFTWYLAMLPIADPKSEQRFNLAVGFSAGTRSAMKDAAFQAMITFAPVCAVSSLYSPKPQTNEVRDGVLHLAWSEPFGEPGPMIMAELDVATGRLRRAWVDGTAASTGAHAELRPQEGAFAGLLERLRAESASYTNDYRAESPLVSAITFLVTDMLDSSILESPSFRSLASEFLGAESKSDLDKTLDSTQASLRRIRSFLLRSNSSAGTSLADVFEPLQDLMGDDLKDVPEGAEDFMIPFSETEAGGVNSMAVVAAAGLGMADDLWPRGSWPWTLMRDACYVLGGQPRFLEADLESLKRSDTVGPLGCLAAARLVGMVNPQLARTFAQRGTNRLHSSALKTDYDLLLRTNGVAGQMLNNALGLLANVDDEALGILAKEFSPADAAMLRDAVLAARGARGRPYGQAVWPALENHWGSGLQPRLEKLLDPFLPQVDRLSDAKALYERGVNLAEGKDGLQDFTEAAQCFRKAAEQGHAGAQLRLGILLKGGQGVAADPAQAAEWFKKAAAAQELHAACEMGRLYLEGRGVPRDQEQAIQWFRRDAERGCMTAQYWVGTLLDAKGDTAGALPWLRQAAENGSVEAQYALGNRLSDALVDAPDYAEAYVWLSLASAQGHRLADVDRRRVKGKLTEEQRAQAQPRIDTLIAQQRERQGKTAAEKR